MGEEFNFKEETENMLEKEQWKGFKGRIWKEEVNTRDFIQQNYKPYDGDASFLAEPTEATNKLWGKLQELQKEERAKGGVLDMETHIVSGLTAYGAGYIDESMKDLEAVVGLQTDKPLKRAFMPYGGIKMAEQACETYGYTPDPQLHKIFTEYHKTHNQGVFDVYTPEIRKARRNKVITGLPDTYGRGRIVGDYRRVALYGIDFLMEEKLKDFNNCGSGSMKEDIIRKREEIAEQYKALAGMKKMAEAYGFDISQPAKDAKEAVQWLYFGYLAAVKENNGAAMSLGRTSTFLDIYAERDLEAGVLTEAEVQEIMDQFIIKLRLVRHLRTPEYNDLFAGDPTWVTEAIGGMGINGKSLVTKNSFRFLHTLTNLGAAPEPNMTVLWSDKLPENFKKYCAKMSIDTDAIQYENDEVMRPIYGDDYAIACCVSPMKVGKQMQFFGARANLAKTLLYAINGGVDERTGKLAVKGLKPITDEVLDFETVKKAYYDAMAIVAKLYVDAMNIIHVNHDKYAYEAGQMALHDTKVGRIMAFGIAGLSVAADSLSAIKYAKVKPIRNEQGIAVDFEIEGDFPKYGNDDDRVDDLAVDLTNKFMDELKKHPLYRGAMHSLSVLTITSNVVYGKKTGSTPDGRKIGEPLAPGANPMHGRDENGALASLNSVAKIPFSGVCQDGVSNTFSIVPDALGKTEESRIDNLSNILDGYFAQGAHHLNVNVLRRETLIDAMENPDNYPTLTIRVSGYAVNFTRLTRNQQLEVISRTFHQSM